ncbi:MAG: hypothetical protein CL811_12330 [Colwelliaceae bacterium]|jgi:4-amino-4-deoxy-L-arabinose transferase-like glycosyltransferase|nr:hypothetical protein [Colwelliaceae bacterium]|tara:strand:+ start:1073 stop:1300 length:228 start_codon:yes stop_codon:yes gene_type:complete
MQLSNSIYVIGGLLLLYLLVNGIAIVHAWRRKKKGWTTALLAACFIGWMIPGVSGIFLPFIYFGHHQYKKRRRKK